MTTSKDSEGQIFISYARKDRKIADWIVRQLTAAGFQIWIDRRDIPGGVAWATELVNAIIEAEAVLLMISPNSIASTWVLKELEIANQNQVRIIPLLLRPIETPNPIAHEIDGLQQIEYWQRRQKCTSRWIVLLRLLGVWEKSTSDSGSQKARCASLITAFLL